MTDHFEIRESVPDDLPDIEKLYPDAFPEEDLLPLVKDLLREAPVALSLVGTIRSALVGHVMFTRGTVSGSNCQIALLGPLAIASRWQRMGFGSAMVRNGLQRLDSSGVTHVFVLGDPGYYGRFGFVTEPNVTPPYCLPSQWRGAWQSIGADDGCCRGSISLPPAWMQPELWRP